MKCRACRQPFTRARPLQVACSLECAVTVGKAKQAKDAEKAQKQLRIETRTARLSVKPRAAWLKETQSAFNRWVRLRDAALPCVSCGRFHEGQYHAGHYLSTGARPELRFEVENVHKQCSACNTHLSGNLVLYRAELIRRIGLARVEWLEGPHEAKKYTVDDLKSIKAEFTKRAKALEV